MAHGGKKKVEQKLPEEDIAIRLKAFKHLFYTFLDICINKS